MNETTNNKNTDLIYFASNGDLKNTLRLLNQGAIRIEGEKVSDMDMKLSSGTEYIIKIGKRRFLKVK